MTPTINRTHARTIVFFPPVEAAAGARPRSARALLFDEQWTLTARWLLGAADMVGTCTGLLCLLDRRKGALEIANAATGECMPLPLPPVCTSTRHDPRAYCFGFDAAAGHYKIVHLPYDYASSSSTGVVYVCTVGGGGFGRRVSAPGAVCCLAAGGAVAGDGAMYWLTHYKAARARLMRFDLNKEEVTSMGLPPFEDARRPVNCRLMAADAAVCVVASPGHDPSGKRPDAANDDVEVWTLEGGGRWCRRYGVQLRRLGRRVTGPHAMLRSHVLLQGEDGGVYAHRVTEKGVVRIEPRREKVLVDGTSRPPHDAKPSVDDKRPCGGVKPPPNVPPYMPIRRILPFYQNHRYKLRQKDAAADEHEHKLADDGWRRGRDSVRTFGYVEPSFAPLEQYMTVHDGRDRLDCN